MASVRVLPGHLVNKIAAGEVIERPASVVKELIENALDAGATRIDVVIEDGGKKLIAVTDNGCGMDSDDLALAFAPHATSKLDDEEALYAISTMGFRGEALASAVSVSHAHIRTRQAGDDSGYEIEAGGDRTGPVRPCPAAPGTTVTIRDLFFNTPARRKFMRSANTELGHVSEQITRLALPHANVAFSLIHNGREVKKLPPADSTVQRVADLFTPEMAGGLIPIARRGGSLDVAGLIAPPEAARSSGKWQYFFLNTRFVRNRLLSHALREAFRGLLEQSRWPAAFVFLRIDPSDVDVNVHPCKIEVRFRDSQRVHGELLAALKETLSRANLTASASLAPAPPAGSRDSEQNDAEATERQQSLRQALADFFKSAPQPQPRLNFSESSGPRPGAAGPGGPERPFHPATGPFATEGAGLTEGAAQGDADRGAAPPPGESEAILTAPGGPAYAPMPASQPAGPAGGTFCQQAIQIHNAYIAAACDDGLLIVDQHALHERLIYNDLRRRLTDGALTGQRLLIPATVAVTEAEADLLSERADLLARLGIEVAPFGPRTMAVQCFPSLLAERGVAAGDLIRELLDKLADNEATDTESLLSDVLEMMACKAAIKAGDPLTPQEMQALLDRREDADKGASCPHGRPTTLRLTINDLEKQFRRT